MAEGSYIGLRRDSEQIIKSTNKGIKKMLNGVPEEKQPEVLEHMLDVRAANLHRAMNKSQ